MIYEIGQLDRLKLARQELDKIKQTVEREYKKSILDLEIAVLESQVRQEVAKRVMILLEAWRNTGKFYAIRFDGKRLEGNPVVTGELIQDFWNAKNEARLLANWSFGIKNPWFE